MSEPDIQIQRDYPQTLVNSQWVKWAAERIAELESIISEALSNMEYYPASLGEYWLVQDNDIQTMQVAIQENNQ